MIDTRTQELLSETVRRQSRSLLQYVGDSFPWTESENPETLARFQEVVEEDRQSIGTLLQFLARHKATPPYLGSYPGWFTTINFVSLSHLLPLLVDEQRKEIAALEADLRGIADEEARSEVQRLLEVKQRQLEKLERLAADQPAVTSAVA